MAKKIVAAAAICQREAIQRAARCGVGGPASPERG
jgi:hypothetical protein